MNQSTVHNEIQKMMKTIIKPFEKLKKDSNDFFDKIDKPDAEFIITNINNKKHVSIEKIEPNHIIPSLYMHGFEDDDERHIKHVYRSIIKFIDECQEIYNVIENYEQIKQNIGDENMTNSNEHLREGIIHAQTELYNLQNDYIWDI